MIRRGWNVMDTVLAVLIVAVGSAAWFGMWCLALVAFGVVLLLEHTVLGDRLAARIERAYLNYRSRGTR